MAGALVVTLRTCYSTL